MSIACPNCGQGTCNAGLSGIGGCTCYPGWTSSTGNCDTCAAGYYGPNCARIFFFLSLNIYVFWKKNNN